MAYDGLIINTSSQHVK